MTPLACLSCSRSSATPAVAGTSEIEDPSSRVRITGIVIRGLIRSLARSGSPRKAPRSLVRA